jgi:hypothetical protein
MRRAEGPLSQEQRDGIQGKSVELLQLYEELRADAKLLVEDLSEGVRLWRAAAALMVLISVLGFFILAIALNPESVKFISVPVEYFAASLMGVSALAGAVVSALKYRKLRRKYQRLFDAAKRMR